MTMSRLSPVFDVDDGTPDQTPDQQERMVITPTQSTGSLTSSSSSAHSSYVASISVPFRYVDPSHPVLHGSALCDWSKFSRGPSGSLRHGGVLIHHAGSGSRGRA